MVYVLKSWVGLAVIKLGEDGKLAKNLRIAAACLKGCRVTAKSLYLIWPNLYGVRTPIYYSPTCIWAEVREEWIYMMELSRSAEWRNAGSVERIWLFMHFFVFPLTVLTHVKDSTTINTPSWETDYCDLSEREGK